MNRHSEDAGRPPSAESAASGVPPRHEPADRLVVTRADQVRALAHPLRTTVLGLLAERPASVAELARATGRPKSTMAHHVGVLHRAGLVQVVRTRRVRAVEERFYGRAARTITIAVDGHDLPTDQNDLAVAAAESAGADEQRLLWSFLRHARLEPHQVDAFWVRMRDLVEEFDRLPRSGATTYGMTVGIYPVEGYPQLPEPTDDPPPGRSTTSPALPPADRPPLAASGESAAPATASALTAEAHARIHLDS